MKRVEIIANQSIEEDLFDNLKRKNLLGHYTKIPGVMGVGNSGPRRGDHIWPEENFILIIYCEESEAEEIRKSVEDVKTLFPDEGIKMFVL